MQLLTDAALKPGIRVRRAHEEKAADVDHTSMKGWHQNILNVNFEPSGESVIVPSRFQMEVRSDQSRKRKASQTSPSRFTPSFESSTPYPVIHREVYHPSQPPASKKSRDSEIFHSLPASSATLPGWDMAYRRGYLDEGFQVPEIALNQEIEGSQQLLPIPANGHWNQSLTDLTVSPGHWTSMHTTNPTMQHRWGYSLALSASPCLQPVPGRLSAPRNRTYGLQRGPSYSDTTKDSSGHNHFSEPVADLSFSESLNGRNHQFCPADFEDTVNTSKCSDGLEVPDWSCFDDMFASGKEGFISIPFQEPSFSSQTDSEPSPAPPPRLSSRNDVLGTDSIEADGLEVNMENTFSPSNSFQKASSIKSPAVTTTDKKHGKTGRRKGPLSLEMKQKVAVIRRLKACWFCWLSKIPCSSEEVCHTCKNSPTSLFAGRVCNRASLSDYSALFFPDQLISHLQEEAVTKFITENVSTFRDSPIKISVSSGPTYPPMILSLREFHTTREDFLDVQRIEEVDLDAECGFKIVTRKALPLGSPLSNISLLTKQCQRHIRSIISSNRNPEMEFGETSIISSKVLFAIERYRISSQLESTDSILEKAVMLHAMHNFMGRVLIVIESPGTEACHNLLLSPDDVYDVGVPSRILSRQLKHIMHSLLRTLTQDVLRDLEKKLRTRTPASWAPCFCTILILCICMEKVQASIDGFAVHSTRKKAGEATITREDGIGISRRLDDLLFADCKVLFHGIYRSGKGSPSQKNENVFNPIRFEVQIDEGKGLTQAMCNLVEDIREILDVHGTEMIELATSPSIDTRDESLESHMKFHKRNSGRLVSDFLRSFLG